MTDIIKIDNGDTFEGSWEQLEDCFGVNRDTLDGFCANNDMKYQILEIDFDEFSVDVDALTSFENQTSERFQLALDKLEWEHETDLERIYKSERAKVFQWFNKKYPKRTLKWVDGMGTCMWVLDDEILDFPDVADVKEINFSDYIDGRKWKKLLPLLEFYRKIQDSTNRIRPYPIPLGDISNY